MTNLVSCQSLKKSYGVRTLFEDLSLGFGDGERCGMIGPNGSGKSTLLKILAGLEDQDSGQIFVKKSTRLIYLAQKEEIAGAKSVEEVLLEVLEEGLNDAERYMKTNQVLGKCGFTDTSLLVRSLSGGWLKRLAIARALVQEPDILLMDEPTNHLDIEGILWLEKVLGQVPFAYVVISHDRYFLDTVTNRIVELSRQYPDGYLQVAGSYRDFLQRKEELLASQARQETSLDNKLRREIEWLSRGPKARATKAKYRIDEAGRLKGQVEDVKARNSAAHKIDIAFAATNRKTKKLLEAHDIGKSFGGQAIFSDLKLILTPKARVGILGANGVGKSTLMHVLAGKTEPDSGKLQRAVGLKTVLFEQKRQGLDLERSLRRTLAPEGDSVVWNGRLQHVVGWAKRFLFTPEQLDVPVGRLSGGEQARIFIAQLMLQEADILFLDEPTNDLDIPSLEVLEESLAEFGGALVLVSHDRFLLDSLTDFVLGFDGEGGCIMYGDYRQWVVDSEKKERKKKPDKTAVRTPKKISGRLPQKKGNKITMAEQMELDSIEQHIASAEEAVAEIEASLALPEVQADADGLRKTCHALQEAQAEVNGLYERWEFLENKDK